MTVTLDQTPVVEGAWLHRNRTQIKAMVGGWNFNRSKFNRAVQAYRQLDRRSLVVHRGIDRGFTPVHSDRLAGELPGGERTDIQSAQLRSQVEAITCDGLEESRNVGDQDDGPLGSERARFTPRVRFGGVAVLPVALGAATHAARSDGACYGVPQPGRRMRPFKVLT